MRHPGIHRLRLEPEVELLGQVVGEVGDDVLRGQPAAQLGQLDDLSEALEDLQVGGHPAADARPLDLDHDLLAGVQGRVVHLGDRRRRERLLVEGGEQLRRLVAELLVEQLVHLVGVGGRHPVEQAAELPGHRLAERARAGRDDLAELDVRRTQVGERLGDLLDDLLLQRAACRQLGDDACAGAGDLPTRHADAGGFDRQRHPVQLGYLAVFSGTHGCSVPNRGDARIRCNLGHNFRRRCAPLSLACACAVREVLGERFDDRAPHRFGQVVAHAVDHDETCAGDGRGEVRPLRGRSIGSSEPWITTVGAVIAGCNAAGCRCPASRRTGAACPAGSRSGRPVARRGGATRSSDGRKLGPLNTAMLRTSNASFSSAGASLAGRIEGQLDHPPPRHRRQRLARTGHDDAQRRQPFGVAAGQHLRDHAAHRRADDVGSFDAEVVEQRAGVLGHVDERVRAPGWAAHQVAPYPRVNRPRRRACRASSSTARCRGGRTGSPGSHA